MADLIGYKIDRMDDVGRDRYKRRRAQKPPKNWVAQDLELTQDGNIRSTLPNVARIITNDPRFFQKIALNELSGQIMLLAPVKTKSNIIPNIDVHDLKNGIPWRDGFDVVVRAVLESENGQGKPGYGFKPSQADVLGGIQLAAMNNAYHPIKERIEKLRDMGPPHRDVVKGFLHRHAGSDNDLYTDTALRLWLLAAVARIDTPGHKFDFAPIFEGDQGLGKSTLIMCIFGEEFFGELDTDLNDRRAVAEQTGGKWCVELPELSAFHKANHNEAKHFMRRRDDDVREAYGRNVEPKPRQFVVAGTTNNEKYLRDPTGNRSFWPIKVNKMISMKDVREEREDLWRQIIWEYDQMRKRQPHGELPLYIKGEALERAQQLQERARKKELWEDWLDRIVTWMETPVRFGELAHDMGWDLLDELPPGVKSEDTMVRRVAFTQDQAQRGPLGLRDAAFTNGIQHSAYEQVVDEMKKLGWENKNRTVGGRKLNWKFLSEESEFDLRRGFAFPVEADAPSESDDEVANNGKDLI